MLFGFVGMSYVSFGPHLQNFSTIGASILSSFKITLSDQNFQDMQDANPTMAVIFFFPFNILFNFVLSNIFLAIMNQTYREACALKAKI